MICVLKNKNNQYVKSAITRLRVDTRTGEVSLQPGYNVELQYTTDIKQARLIEDPNMDAVLQLNLEAVVVATTQPELQITGNIYEA